MLSTPLSQDNTRRSLNNLNARFSSVPYVITRDEPSSTRLSAASNHGVAKQRRKNLTIHELNQRCKLKLKIGREKNNNKINNRCKVINA